MNASPSSDQSSPSHLLSVETEEELKTRPILMINCLPDAAVFVIPMLLNTIAVLLMEQEVAGSPLTVTNVVTGSIAFGYSLFACTVIHLLLYKHIRNAVRQDDPPPPLGKDIVKDFFAKFERFGQFLCFLLSGGASWVALLLILYFAFFPFPGQAYVAGGAVIIILGPILGLKGILIPYALNNVELLGILVLGYHFIVRLVATFSWEELRYFARRHFTYLRNRWVRHGLTSLLIFQFFLGIVVIIVLVFLLKPGNIVQE